ncbi:MULTISPECIES: AraC family transcriptional regulator [unclassified Sphingobacterium]|uniref:AraC family transcriptional regulator n=1 Tax=unclassified Sphingobacterium TaxID=2609468 RepID=UPI0025DD1FB2|nr:MULTISPECIES: AraC family transcriptional regulator [unclassified Sphingobacterium]
MEYVSELSKTIDQYPESILVMRQQIEQKLPAHQHAKGQLLLVFGGIAYLQTLERDFYIPSNHYIWIPGDYAHNLMYNAQDLHIINIYFPAADDDGAFYKELGIYPVSRLLFELLAFSETWQGSYFAGCWEYELMSTVKKLLAHENLQKFSIQLPTTDDSRMRAITDDMRHRIDEPLSLEESAQKFGLSVRSLTRLFQQCLHLSFVQYLKMLRVIRAMDLLKDTSLSISEIAYQVGYSNISAFSNTFFQLTNIRPSDFRSKLQ